MAPHGARFLLETAALYEPRFAQTFKEGAHDLLLKAKSAKFALAERGEGDGPLARSLALLVDYLVKGFAPETEESALALRDEPAAGERQWETDPARAEERGESRALANFILINGYIVREELDKALQGHALWGEIITGASVPGSLGETVKALSSSSLVSALLSAARHADALNVFRRMGEEIWRADPLSRPAPRLTVVGRGPADPEKGEKRPDGRQSAESAAANLTLVSGPVAPAPAPRLPSPFASPPRSSVRAFRAENESEYVLREGLSHAIGRLFAFKDPAAQKLQAAINILMSLGYAGNWLAARDLYESVKELPFAQERWGGGRRLAKAALHATALSSRSLKAAQRRDRLLAEARLSPVEYARYLVSVIYARAQYPLTDETMDVLEELFHLDLPDEDDKPVLIARAFAILIGSYCAERDLPSVKELFREMDGLGYRHEIIIERFRASIEIIRAYAQMGEMRLALSLFKPLDYLEGFEEHNCQRVRAATAMCVGFAKKGMLAQARKFFNAQNALDVPVAPRDRLGELLGAASATVDLLAIHERDLFRFQEALKDRDYVSMERAVAARALMEAYAEKKDARNVLAVFSTVDFAPRSKALALTRMGLVLTLFNCFLKNGELLRARDVLFDQTRDLFPYEEIQSVRGGMATSLMRGFCEEKALTEAKSVYEMARFPGESPDARETRASLASLMISVHASSGQLPEALALYESEDFQSLTEETRGYRAEAALSLAEAYVAEKKDAELLALFESGSWDPSGPEDLPRRLAALSRLVVVFAAQGELRRAMSIYEEFPAASSSLKAAAAKIQAALALVQAYRARGDGDGEERMRQSFAKFTPLERKCLSENEERGAENSNCS
jgi:hypothetical protein